MINEDALMFRALRTDDCLKVQKGDSLELIKFIGEDQTKTEQLSVRMINGEYQIIDIDCFIKDYNEEC